MNCGYEFSRKKGKGACLYGKGKMTQLSENDASTLFQYL